MLVGTQEINISKKQIKAILHDTEKTAKAIHLLYVNDCQPGIQRVKRGKNFIYFMDKKRVKDSTCLNRIKSLVIPPAWERVWICPKENGHLQATGFDVRGRKQYRYHPLWNSLRNQTKFYRLYEFGRSMPEVRKHLKKDLSLPGLSLEKVLATVVSLMEHTSIRIGNSAYEKLYGSFGLTTLKDKHVKIEGPQMKFVFKGKKGVAQNISIRNKRLAAIVKKCRDIPGQDLFQYIDENGDHKSIDSGMVNHYLKTISGGQDFTAKDFRTWSGSVHALEAFKEIEIAETIAQMKRNVVAVLDTVAGHLGNTRTVCKKYYVHPVLISLYENKKLHMYFEKFKSIKFEKEELTCEEQMLMMILEKEGLAIH
jgi:DNA topoisomerase-1